MSKRTDTFYSKFSSLYPVAGFFLQTHKKRLFSEINNSAPGSLLEIGIGNGSDMKLYKRHKVTGIDTSPGMLNRAQKNNTQNVSLKLMSGENLRFENECFDYVVLSHVIAVVDNPEQLLTEAYRVLKPKGKLFILNHFTPANLLRLLDLSLQPLARALHFKSRFYIEDLQTLNKFSLLKRMELGPCSYFKLLVLCKP